MDQNKMNGSADLLAKAIRQVFVETQENAFSLIGQVEGRLESKIDRSTKITQENNASLISQVEERLENKIDQSTNTTNENMQKQLAQHRKDIAEDIKRQIRK